MKITKRQLRRIIKEEKAKLAEYGGRPYDPTVPSEQSKQLSAGMKTTVDDYVAWAEENGHITPAASSVVASYIVEDPKREGSKVVIADAFGMMVSEITREVERQQAERTAMMGESKMKITKRQLRRIIKEEKAKLLRESMEAHPYHTPKSDEVDKALEAFAYAAVRKLTDNERMIHQMKKALLDDIKGQVMGAYDSLQREYGFKA